MTLSLGRGRPAAEVSHPIPPAATSRRILLVIAWTAAAYVAFPLAAPAGLTDVYGPLVLGGALGVSAGAVVRAGRPVLVPAALTAMAAVLVTFTALGHPLWHALVMGVISGLELAGMSWLLLRWRVAHLDRPVDVLGLLVIGTGVGLAAGGPASALLALGGELEGTFAESVLLWTTDEVFGVVCLLPVVVTLPSPRAWQWRRAPEFIAIAAGSVAVSVYQFLVVTPGMPGPLGWPYLLILGPLLLASRMGTAATAPVLAVLSMLAVRLTVEGHGVFGYSSPSLLTALITVQLFVVVMATTTLMMAVLRDDRLRTLRAALDSHVFLREVIAAYHDPVFAKAYEGPDDPGRYVLVNRGWSKGTGIDSEQALGRSDRDLLEPQIAEMVWRNDQAVLAADKEVVVEEPMLLPDGERRVFSSRKFPLHDALGDPWGVGGVSVDVTEMVANREAQDRYLALMRAVFDLSPTPTVRLEVAADAPVTVLDANEAMQRLMAAEDGHLGTCDLMTCVEPDYRDDLERLLASAAEAGADQRPQPVELPMRSLAGDAVWARVSAAAVGRSDERGTTELVVQFEDMTARRLAQEQLAQQALTDALTGLPNRRALSERIDQALGRLQRHPGAVTVMFADLDRFKEVNDSLGHEAGDQLLREVADRLRAALRPEDTVARIGGDEFVMLLEGIADPSEVMIVAMRLQEGLHQPWVFADREFAPGMSMGVAMTADSELTADELLRRADVAMYRAKDRGRGRVEFYDLADDAIVQEAVAIQHDLRRAIEGDGLHLAFQPIVDLRRGGVVGAEALVRLTRPDGSILPPHAFIPHAESSGLVVPMGAWVIDRALRDLAAWPGDGHRGYVTVNVSPTQLRQEGFAHELLARARDLGADPTRLGIEVTEHALIRDPRRAGAALAELRAAGVRIALDDFGTGYSSLSWLTDFPVDLLKIDRAFVAEIVTDERRAAVVRGIIEMSHELGMVVIAEGVETDEQRELLVGMRCELGQGYLFGRPGALRD